MIFSTNSIKKSDVVLYEELYMLLNVQETEFHSHKRKDIFHCILEGMQSLIALYVDRMEKSTAFTSAITQDVTQHFIVLNF